jgi:hypothetical protein
VGLSVYIDHLLFRERMYKIIMSEIFSAPTSFCELVITLVQIHRRGPSGGVLVSRNNTGKPIASLLQGREAARDYGGDLFLAGKRSGAFLDVLRTFFMFGRV